MHFARLLQVPAASKAANCDSNSRLRTLAAAAPELLLVVR
jgi:hypothetical protein